MEIRVSKIEKRQGAVAQFESRMATYTVFQQGERVWVDAYGRGGRKIQTPHVRTVQQAREWCESQCAPAQRPEDAITI